MEKIKEENKILISLRNNYFSMIMLISSGLAGLFFANISLYKIIGLFIVGSYFNLLFILKFQDVQNKLKKNMENFK